MFDEGKSGLVTVLHWRTILKRNQNRAHRERAKRIETSTGETQKKVNERKERRRVEKSHHRRNQSHCLKMAIISITVYASDGNEAENRSDANNGQSTTEVSAFSHDDVLQISYNITHGHKIFRIARLVKS